MLDVDRLRALNAVATYGSVAAAAEALALTPSAVSQQIAKLERETKATLLEKNGRGVRLTDAARLLADHAADIVNRLEHAEAEFEAHRGQVGGALRLAAFATAARGLLPEVLRLLGHRHPRLAISIAESEPPDALREVVRGRVDVAVLQDWENLPLAVPDGLERAHLLDDIVDLALPSGHRLANQKVIRLRDVAAERWISSPPGAVCYDLLVHTIRSYDQEPKIAHSAAEYPTQLALAAAGFGIATLPRLGRGDLAEIVPGVTVVPSTPALRRSVYAVWRVQVARRPAVRATVDALRAIASGRPLAGPEKS